MESHEKESPEPLKRFLSEPSFSTFATVVETYQLLVLEIVHHVTGDLAAAEDVCQDVFWKLIQHRPRRSSVRSPRSYISRMAYSHALLWKRSEKRRRERERQAAKPDSVTDEEIVQSEELREAVNALPAKLRIPLYLHFFQGLSLIEISYVLKCHRQTVSTYITKAKNLLKKKLGPGIAAALASWPTDTEAHLHTSSNLSDRILSLGGRVKPSGFAIPGAKVLTLVLSLLTLITVGTTVRFFSGAAGHGYREHAGAIATIAEGVKGSAMQVEHDPESNESASAAPAEARRAPRRIRHAEASPTEQVWGSGVRESVLGIAGHGDQDHATPLAGTAVRPVRFRSIEAISDHVTEISCGLFWNRLPDPSMTVSPLGDVNGDGCHDIAFLGDFAEGEAVFYFLLGGNRCFDGIDLSTWETWGVRFRTGRGPRAYVPRIGLGDIDGDGFDDIAFSSLKRWLEGAGSTACILFGTSEFPLDFSTDDLAQFRTLTISPERDVLCREGTAGLTSFGSGDCDGDGIPDLILGAGTSSRKNHPHAEGLVYLVFGTRPPPSHIDLTEAGRSVRGCRVTTEARGGESTAGFRFGLVVSSGGDFNQDGYDDIVVSAPGDTSDNATWCTTTSEIVIIFGRETWPAALHISDSRDQGICRISPTAAAHIAFNHGSTALDDLTGDGVPDVLLSQLWGGRDTGVYLISGRLLEPGDVSVEDIKATFFATRYRTQLLGASIGDWNGDARLDLSDLAQLATFLFPGGREYDD